MDYSSSDQALLLQIGQFVQSLRLSQNRTQQELAQASGLSRSTISQLEKGSGATLLSLIQVLRVLNRLELLDAFDSGSVISPLAMAKREQKKRRRARTGKGDRSAETDINPW